MRSLLFLTLFFSFSLLAAEHPCPNKIKTVQSLGQQLKGWKKHQDSSMVNVLRAVDYYDGPPAEGAQLVPDNGDSLKDPKWTFSQKEIWQVCLYTNTTMTLTKKLPKGTKSCQVIFNKEVSPQIDSITCQ